MFTASTGSGHNGNSKSSPGLGNLQGNFFSAMQVKMDQNGSPQKNKQPVQHRLSMRVKQPGSDSLPLEEASSASTSHKLFKSAEMFLLNQENSTREPKIFFKTNIASQGTTVNNNVKMEEALSTSTTKIRSIKKGGKISRGEKNRRLNKKLKKILVPKNALMVLNEIVGSTNFELTKISNPASLNEQNVSNFKATINIDGKIHEGFGKSKPSAKTAAAEAALCHLVISKMGNESLGNESMQTKDDEDDEEYMEVNEDFSICHLASYAIYKLFNTWEEGGMILSRSSSCSSLAGSFSDTKSKVGKSAIRPSKKLPENPELVNPVMLLNQMYPNAVYEELGQTGTPPNHMFTIKCTIGDEKFIGHGQNKKVARREAAYCACKELLGIKYPTTVP